jgi:ABC-2 type transport system ATP-binding protein
VLDLVDLGYKRDAYVTSLSRGMTQRWAWPACLLHDPQVLLLDEPASGLDPRARIEIRGLLKELGEMGKTIMVSSHILPELADICNKVGIIRHMATIDANQRCLRSGWLPPFNQRPPVGRPVVLLNER